MAVLAERWHPLLATISNQQPQSPAGGLCPATRRRRMTCPQRRSNHRAPRPIDKNGERSSNCTEKLLANPSNDSSSRYSSYDLSEDGDELNEHSRRISVEQLHPLRHANKGIKCKKITPRRYCDDLDTDGVNLKRNMGARKWRRVEHARILMTFTDLEDICEDGSDIYTPPTTAFEKLFTDRENMKMWKEFCQKDELEQKRILNFADFSRQKNLKFFGAGKTASPYSGAACFDRIDRKSRVVLLGKKVNWAFIDFLERELRNVFRIDYRNQQDTTVTFIGHYPASADRLLAHIVARWLGLSSQSITDPSTGERITEIRNRRPLIPPQTSLIEHLETKILGKHIDFVPFSMRDGDEQSFPLAEKLAELKVTSSSDSEESWEKI